MAFTSLSWKVQIVFIATGVFVGLLVSTQFRNALPNSSYPYDEFQAQQDLIKSYSDDQAVLKSRLVNLRKQIEEKQQQASQLIERNSLETLSALKKEIGLEAVKGEGIEITLNDGLFAKRDTIQDLDQSLVQAADLRDMVNILFSAQVTAIAINDQRVIASTPISSVGNTMLVNNFHLLPPFTITAIGDPEIILQRLNDPKSLPDLQKRVKAQKIQWSLLTKKTLVAPVYNSDFRLQFIQELKSQNQ